MKNTYKEPKISAVHGHPSKAIYQDVADFRPDVRLHQISGKVISGAREVYSNVEGRGYVAGSVTSHGGQVSGRVDGRSKVTTSHDTEDNLLIQLKDDSELRLTITNAERFWREGQDIEVMLMSNDEGGAPVSLFLPSTNERLDFKDQFSVIFPKMGFFRQALPNILKYLALSLVFLFFVVPWLYGTGSVFFALFFGLLGTLAIPVSVILPVELAHHRVFKELTKVPFLPLKKTG